MCGSVGDGDFSGDGDGAGVAAIMVVMTVVVLQHLSRLITNTVIYVWQR